MIKKFLHRSYRFFYKVEKWRRRRFTLTGATIAYIAFFSGILGTDVRSNLVHQVFTLLFSILLFAFVWSKFPFRFKLAAIRELPRYATAGEPLVYHVEVRNLTAKPQTDLSFYENTLEPLPSLEELASLREPGEEQRNLWDRKILYYRWLWIISKKRILDDQIHTLADLPAGGRVKCRVEITPRCRGYLHFRGFEMARPDPFGLCRTLSPIAAGQTLVVMPKRYRLPPVRWPGSRKHHARGVSLASSIGNQEEFISLRDYRPGDPMRRIHWRSSAKKDKLIIKEYQDEFYVRQALILDTFFNLAYSEIFEEAVSIAASFVCSLQTQESLLDLIFVGDRTYRFSSGRGTASYDYLLEILSAVQICQDKPFAAIAPAVLDRVHLFSGCICVLLAWDEPRMALVRELKNRGVPLLVVVIADKHTPASIDPGPMRDSANHFWVLPAGDIEKRLAGLGSISKHK